MPSCDKIIEEFMAAVHAEVAGERQRYALRQFLHGLVRQAKSEHALEIRQAAERLLRIEQRNLCMFHLRKLRRDAIAEQRRFAQRELEFGCGQPAQGG